MWKKYDKKILMKFCEAKKAAARVMLRCNKLAKISEVTNEITRTYLSVEHFKVNMLVGTWMQSAGLKIWQDAIGNICGRYEGYKKKLPAILLGSHLDTVKNAGKYDGILGVLIAIEIISWLSDNNLRLPVAIEIIGFGDEEGTRFHIPLLGSRGIIGKWCPSWINYKDDVGITLAEAMKKFGLDFNNINLAIRNVTDIIAYLELHIEQGPILYQKNISLGVVQGIHGARRLSCCFTGESGHAGTVPMIYRKDPLLGTAEWIRFIEQQTLNYDSVVTTIGKFHCFPGSVNVIPSKVCCSLDIRGIKDNLIENLLAILLNQAKKIALKRNLKFSNNEYYHINTLSFDSALQIELEHVLQHVQNSSISLFSGAGHDAISMSKYWPVAMLFIRCIHGVSHCPEESVLEEDVAKGIQAYLQVVYNLSQKNS